MSDQEVLTKAMDIVTATGWKHRNGWTYLSNYKKPAPFNSVQFADEFGEVWHMPIESLIFDHDFARALWGTRDCTCTPKKLKLSVLHDTDCGAGKHFEYGFKYHLQQMVIAKERIKYLGEHLPKSDIV